ncbi:hypothetical protein AVEN_158833-1 [Araneus ventricosus]|uniref:Uncharacterized protein n=1 Tax=Araneus ventricosus TaxID=182803 RepID=A0A4Y2T9E6_ARAVE|nr:hypothetical protein AVEN_158833-1 [Araneus ventricosus]
MSGPFAVNYVNLTPTLSLGSPASLAGALRTRSFRLRVRNSDVSLTRERIRGSDSSKGTTGSDSDQKERIRGIGFVNPWIRIYEYTESVLLIPRHHDSDSESLIRIYNLRRGFISFWNERYIIWGHGCR